MRPPRVKVLYRVAQPTLERIHQFTEGKRNIPIAATVIFGLNQSVPDPRSPRRHMRVREEGVARTLQRPCIVGSLAPVFDSFEWRLLPPRIAAEL